MMNQRVGYKMLIIWMCTLMLINVSWAAQHRGKFTDDVGTKAQLIIPRKVDTHGNHLTLNLTHIHPHRNHNERLHYHIDLNNSTLHLELDGSNHEIIAPQLIIERHRRNIRTRKRIAKNTNCHYQGHVRGDHQSRVALSACDGITGLIRTSGNEYLIEPSKHHAAHHHHGHPHVIFQRSSTKNKTQKKKKKRQKFRKNKVASASNCGTREPTRPTETKIEWHRQGNFIVQAERKRNSHHHHQLLNPAPSSAAVAPSRSKRSISSPRHVEVLVVADSSMVTFHLHDDIENYLLTIMNVVSSLYKDPAIGNLINIVVVKIVLLEEDESDSDLNITYRIDDALKNFCRWQKRENPKDDEHPHHHDVAILITRKNMCNSDVGCSILGISYVSGMCSLDRCCSINEDNGITLAHTISHELGHSFGMYHDELNKTGCNGQSGSVVHIMTPIVVAGADQVSWSNCSRRYITNFLDQGLGRCLDDTPTKREFEYPDLPPGAMYNVELQCRLQFNVTDENIDVCHEDICSKLYCQIGNNCTSQGEPAAPGTHCGKHKWCQNKKCVPIEDTPSPVDGGWGNWNEWSACSHICGGGISMQSRQCDHPTPANGGLFCVGERIRYRTCNQMSCGKDELSFRSLQCAQFNTDAVKWLAYFNNQYPCKLECIDSDDTIIEEKKRSASDGTPCNSDSNDMCIAGICRKVGCDWIVDSNRTEDQCGVCGGTGDTCTTITGKFTNKLIPYETYVRVVEIPKGSRRILIEEILPSANYISISRSNSNEWYLNGNRTVILSSEFKVAQTYGSYVRDYYHQDRVKIHGPIKHNITVYILSVNKKNNGIKYEYTLSSNATIADSFTWKLGDWAACSATCGGGTQHRNAVCYQTDKGIVDDENCWSNANNTQPSDKFRKCNEDPCPAHWWIGPWQLCSVTCRKHSEGAAVQRRTIMCIDHNEMALPDNRCQDDLKPIEIRSCLHNLPLCPVDTNNNEISRSLRAAIIP